MKRVFALTLFFCASVAHANFEAGGIVGFEFIKEQAKDSAYGVGAKVRANLITPIFKMKGGVIFFADIRRSGSTPWMAFGPFVRGGGGKFYVDIGAGIANGRDIKFIGLGIFGSLGLKLSQNVSFEIYSIYRTHSRAIIGFDATPLIMINL